jgi:hypothetical protein
METKARDECHAVAIGEKDSAALNPADYSFDDLD